jgi:hypothetical protein
MRFLVKVSSAAKKNGFKIIQKILKQQKPEAAYFIADGGQRTGIKIASANAGHHKTMPRRRLPPGVPAPKCTEATSASTQGEGHVAKGHSGARTRGGYHHRCTSFCYNVLCTTMPILGPMLVSGAPNRPKEQQRP